MDTITKKMSDAGSGRPITEEHHGHAAPKKGDQFRCEECGMEIQVTKDCPCDDADHVHFHCCGQEMHQV